MSESCSVGSDSLRPQERGSACITSVNVLLVRVSHTASPNARGGEKINSICKAPAEDYGHFYSLA